MLTYSKTEYLLTGNTKTWSHNYLEQKCTEIDIEEWRWSIKKTKDMETLQVNPWRANQTVPILREKVTLWCKHCTLEVKPPFSGPFV